MLLVPVKSVVDYRLSVRVDAKGHLSTQGLKHGLNPFDEIALEAALQWRAAGHIDRVEVVTVGQDEKVLRSALAMGADSATLIEGEVDQPLMIAHVLKVFAAQHSSLKGVIMGKQAIDDDCGQVGPMLAGLLGWPQATCAAAVRWLNDCAVEVDQEDDYGQKQITLSAPWVITTDLRLATPRFPNVMALMQAQKAPIHRCALSDFECPQVHPVRALQYESVERKRAGQVVSSADELMACLKASGVL